LSMPSANHGDFTSVNIALYPVGRSGLAVGKLVAHDDQTETDYSQDGLFANKITINPDSTEIALSILFSPTSSPDNMAKVLQHLMQSGKYTGQFINIANLRITTSQEVAQTWQNAYQPPNSVSEFMNFVGFAIRQDPEAKLIIQTPNIGIDYQSINPALQGAQHTPATPPRPPKKIVTHHSYSTKPKQPLTYRRG